MQLECFRNNQKIIFKIISILHADIGSFINLGSTKFDYIYNKNV